jgi:23S rRNA pseudouridine1911/1915/1917 synthase
VLARSEPVHAALKQLLASRELVREYLALVEGRPPARRGTIDAPLGRDRRVRTRVSTDTEEPRAATTHFEVERAFEHDTLLRVRLDTGRTHQIRAHMLAIGHPIAGDREYGTAGRHGLRRQFLHAARLAFPHPVTGSSVDVSSPLPADLAAALEVAGADEGQRRH